jgi:hydroxymethylglutaryl-CoA lyase
MPNYLKVYEVGPRDGLQNEAALISTEQKKKLIKDLINAGLRAIELTSFVHPKAVPQMADADEIMRDTLTQYPDERLDFIGLVFNERGYDRALAAGCKAIAIGAAVSESFSQANTNMSTTQALEMCHKLTGWAKKDNIWTRAYISTAWVCPFEGYIRPEKVVAYAEKLWEAGVDELALADTIGHASPIDVGSLMEELGKRLDMSRLAVHLHDTQAMGLVNTAAAIQAGVRIHDASIGGLGGCPFAPGAAGNLATEDLVFLAFKMGLGTGVDFPALWDIVADLETMVGRPVGGRIRAWWESEERLAEDGPTVGLG